MLTSKRRLSIDIGNNRIKITEAAVSKSGLQLKKAAVLDTPENSYKDGEILNIIAVQQCIETGLKENGIKTKEAVFTANSTKVITREIVIPYVKEKNITGIVREEMEQYLPLSLDSYVLEYTNLGRVLEGLKIRVVVFPKDMAKKYFDLCLNLKLKPLALDIHSNGMSKLVKKVDRINDKPASTGKDIFIDLGDGSFAFNGFDHGELKFTRVMDVGLEDVNRYFKEDKGMSNDEVIKALGEIDLDDKEDEEVYGDFNVVNEAATRWARDIERLYSYYTNSLKESADRIFIYGGGSRIKGIENVIGDFLGVHVEKVHEISFKNGKKLEENVDVLLNTVGSSFREKR